MKLTTLNIINHYSSVYSSSRAYNPKNSAYVAEYFKNTDIYLITRKTSENEYVIIFTDKYGFRKLHEIDSPAIIGVIEKTFPKRSQAYSHIKKLDISEIYNFLTTFINNNPVTND